MEPPASGATAGVLSGGFSELDDHLRALLEEKEARMAKRRRRGNLMFAGSILLLLTASGAGYQTSPDVRHSVNTFLADVKLVGRDLKKATDVSEMRAAYDRSLDKIGSHSKDIDKATRALGVDPTKVREDGMEAAERQLSGGNGPTTASRNRLVMERAGNPADRRTVAVQPAPVPRPRPAAPPQPIPPPPATNTPVVHDTPLTIP